MRTHDIPGLATHIQQFGLLRNKRSEEVFQGMMEYKFLSPLNSRMLSAFHSPAQA
jgi:hypothetical protein